MAEGVRSHRGDCCWRLHPARSVVAQSALALHTEFNANVGPNPLYRSYGLLRTAVIGGTKVTVNARFIGRLPYERNGPADSSLSRPRRARSPARRKSPSACGECRFTAPRTVRRNTYQTFAQILGSDADEAGYHLRVTRMRSLPATVVSTTLDAPLDCRIRPHREGLRGWPGHQRR
jgi:hypothetical protein